MIWIGNWVEDVEFIKLVEVVDSIKLVDDAVVCLVF